MSVGIWQLVLILLVVLILFGAGRLPRVMGDIGKGIKSLKEGLKDEEPPVQMKDVSPSVVATESTQHKEV
jgi:sec-independent protein translocase protein TatA